MAEILERAEKTLASAKGSVEGKASNSIIERVVTAPVNVGLSAAQKAVSGVNELVSSDKKIVEKYKTGAYKTEEQSLEQAEQAAYKLAANEEAQKDAKKKAEKEAKKQQKSSFLGSFLKSSNNKKSKSKGKDEDLSL